MMELLRAQWAKRPWWMNLMMLFCGFMAFVYMPWDFFVKPTAVDEEVWFGVRFEGVAAKWLEVPHFLVYALGFFGFWHMHRWMHPWAAVYLAQVAFSFIVWPWLYLDERGVAYQLISSLVPGALWIALTVCVWNSAHRFRAPSA